MLSHSTFRIIFSFVTILTLTDVASAANVFINEFHYDNDGTDTNEGVELIGTAGTNLQDWSLVFYNGSNGSPYATALLSGIIPDLSNGFGTLFFPQGSMQNGPADGIALVDNNNTVWQFLSYEGVISASSGPAVGLSSIDIGLSEATTTPVGQSLQLVGSGNTPADFSWLLAEQSMGAINAGQTVTASTIPLPASLPLFASAILGLLIQRRSPR
jgi:hypothetical protein